MVEDACFWLYNISIDLKGSQFNQERCKSICPDRKSLGYLVYLYHRSEKPPSRKYILKIRQKDGKLCLSPELREMEMYDGSGRTEAIHMFKEDISKELEEFLKLSRGGQRNLIQLVTLLETAMLLYQNKVDFLDIFISFGNNWFDKEDDYNIDLFMEKFWNISYILLDGIVNNRAKQEVLDSLLFFLEGLQRIYEQKDKIAEQLGEHHENILCGIDAQECLDDNVVLGCNEYDTLFRLRQKEECAARAKAKEWKEFLFNKGGTVHPYKEVSGELAMVLKRYLEKYNEHRHVFEQKKVDEVCRYLQQLADNGKDVTEIAGLEKLSLDSEKAVIADAKLILNYMQKVRQRKLILNYLVVPERKEIK